MPKGLRRYYGQGHLHFITFSCYRRLPLLKHARARDVFVKELAKLREELGFQLIGYVVMPEHVHLLISEPQRGHLRPCCRKSNCALPESCVSGEGAHLRARCICRSRSVESPCARFWQARFCDFNVYSERKRIEKLNYMHANPMNRRLEKHPKDWPWSSWGFYTRVGKVLVQIDV